MLDEIVQLMKAIITNKYGGVEVLKLQEVKKPVITDNEILVQVHACSVNPIDWKVRRGDFKFLTGRKPPRILGGDYAGIVVEAGRQVTKYEPGDTVWGCVETFKRGTYAEFVKVKAEEIGPKPQNLNFEEAASLPLVGLTAYQALVYAGRLKKGDHILVNGASGGVGLAAIQIVKALGCTVTGVCSAKNLSLVKKMGADEVIDYTKQDVLKSVGIYDIFFDVVANKSFSQAKMALKPGGTYVRTLPSFDMILGPLINIFSAQKVKFMDCKACTNDLDILKEMVENEKLVPRIEKVYPLDQVRAAHTRSETGRVVGKLVLKVV
jgi:NADPH:quinone reductase-like Zn-dependent oxidoreductase